MTDTITELSPDVAAMLEDQRKAAVVEPHKDAPPPLTSVTLPGGLLDPLTGQVAQDAEVRELTGLDEEALSRSITPARAMLLLLERAVVRIGEEKPTKDTLANLLLGDRIALLLGIRIVTWGRTETYEGLVCPHCQTTFDLAVDLIDDVPSRALEDPLADRTFEVALRNGTAKVTLPLGDLHKQLLLAEDKTQAELNTMLLTGCVREINGLPVMGDKSVLALSWPDRDTLLLEIAKRNPGPQLDAVKDKCPSCEKEFPFPLSVMSLFPFRF